MSGSWFDYDEYLQPRHLKGKRITLTIIRTDEVEVDQRGKKSIKPVLFFKGTPKYLFLNKTNRQALVDMFGEQRESCIGKRISIRAMRMPNGKDTIEILAPQEHAPASPLPTETTTKSALDQLWDLATQHEVAEPKVVIEELMRKHGGDADAALAEMQKQFEAATA